MDDAIIQIAALMASVQSCGVLRAGVVQAWHQTTTCNTTILRTLALLEQLVNVRVPNKVTYMIKSQCLKSRQMPRVCLYGILAIAAVSACARHLLAAPKTAISPHHTWPFTHGTPCLYTHARLYLIPRRLDSALHQSQNAIGRTVLRQAGSRSMDTLRSIYHQAGRQHELPMDPATQARYQPPVNVLLAVYDQQIATKGDAIRVLARYLKSNPTDIAALNHMIDLARLQHQPALAFHDLVLAAATGKVPPAQLRKLITALIGLDRNPGILQKLAPAHTSSAGVHATSYAAWKYTLLGMAAQRVRQTSAAAGYYRLAAQHDQSFWPAHKALVQALLQEEHFAPATLQAALYVHQQRFGAAAGRLLVRTYARQDRLAHALHLALAFQRQYPQDYKTALQIASLYARRGQRQHQLRQLERVMKEFPGQRHTYRLLIDLADDLDNWPLAAHYRRLFIQRFPTATLTAVFLASRYARHGHLHHTEKIFLAKVRAYPASAQFRQALIGVESLLHQPAKAAIAIASALGHSSRHSLDAVQDLCVCYLAAGRKSLAVHTAARFARHHAQSPRWQIFYAQILEAAGHTRRAGHVLKQTALRHPRSELATEAWATFLAGSTNPALRPGALTIMKRFMRDHGTTTSRLNFLADLQIGLGEDGAMVRTYQRILVLMPANGTANNDLGYYWAGKRQHLRAAKKMIMLALKNYPGQSAFRDSLGWVLYQQRRYHQALDQFARAIALPGGQNPVGLEHYANALYQLNHSAAAISYWQKALKLLASTAHSSAHARMVRKRILRQLRRAKALRALSHSQASQQL